MNLGKLVDIHHFVSQFCQETLTSRKLAKLHMHMYSDAKFILMQRYRNRISGRSSLAIAHYDVHVSIVLDGKIEINVFTPCDLYNLAC